MILKLQNTIFYIKTQRSNMVSSEKDIILPKTRACVKSYGGETEWMHFFIEEAELLEIYEQ